MRTHGGPPLMRKLQNALLAMLAWLAIFSTSCHSPVAVAQPVPAPTCDPGPRPLPPTVQSFPCASSEGEWVCVPPKDAAAIWKFGRDVDRYAERVQVCLDASSANPAMPTMQEVKTFLDKIVDRRLTFTVIARSCTPEENAGTAWYFPMARTILLCAESLADKDPGYVRFIIAHELSHAYIRQLDLPFTGSSEAAADELAVYLLTRAGYADAVLSASEYYKSRILDLFPGFFVHPTNEQRYHMMRCLGNEAKGKTAPLCDYFDLERVRHSWERLLK